MAAGFGFLAMPLHAQYVYVTNGSAYAGDSSVSAFSIGPLGVLTPIKGSPFSTGKKAQYSSSIALDPAGQFAYVVNSQTSGDDAITSFSIASDGALTLLGNPITNLLGANSVGVDPTGQFAYVTDFFNYEVSGYTIGSNGALTLIGTTTAGTQPTAVAFDPAGQFAFVANWGSKSIWVYTIGSSGTLTLIQTIAAGKEPNSLAVDPTADFIYVADTTGKCISGYSYSSSGLTLVPGSPFKTKMYPWAVTVDPTGGFVYAVGQAIEGGGVVYAYSIESTGALKPVPKSPFKMVTPGFPSAVGVDPSGQFVYAVDEQNAEVFGYSIGSNGALKKIPGSPFVTGSTGTGPTSIAISK